MSRRRGRSRAVPFCILRIGANRSSRSAFLSKRRRAAQVCGVRVAAEKGCQLMTTSGAGKAAWARQDDRDVAFVAGQQGIWMPLIDQRTVLLQARHAGMESESWRFAYDKEFLISTVTTRNS